MPVTNLPYDSRLNERAKELRRKMTPQERKLWHRFLKDYSIKIYKQRVIKFFVVDFYCAEARLVIELDGSQHYTEQGESLRRRAELYHGRLWSRSIAFY